MSKRKIHTLAVIVGQNIALKRKAKGLSQAALAERLGIGADSLSRTEKGAIAPRFPRLEQISEVLECSIPDIFRPFDDNVQGRAQSIADMIRVLSPQAQEDVVELVCRIVAFKRLA